MGEVIISGGDNYWKTKKYLLNLVKEYAHRAAVSANNLTKRNRNLAKMNKLVRHLDSEFELYEPLMYPLTPQKCGFKGAVSTFHQVMVWIIKNPSGVVTAENW